MRQELGDTPGGRSIERDLWDSWDQCDFDAYKS
jgi:hypothetical protein